MSIKILFRKRFYEYVLYEPSDEHTAIFFSNRKFTKTIVNDKIRKKKDDIEVFMKKLNLPRQREAILMKLLTCFGIP